MLNGSIQAEQKHIDQAIREHEEAIKRLQAARIYLDRAVDVLKQTGDAGRLSHLMNDALHPHPSVAKPTKKYAALRKQVEKQKKTGIPATPATPARDDDPPHEVESKPAKYDYAASVRSWEQLRRHGYRLGDMEHKFPQGVGRMDQVDVYCIANGKGDEHIGVRAGALDWALVYAWKPHQPATPERKQEIHENPPKANAEIVVRPRVEGNVLTRLDGKPRVQMHKSSVIGERPDYKKNTRTGLLTDASYNLLRKYRRPMRTREMLEVLAKQKSTAEIKRMPRPIEQFHSMLSRDGRFKNLGMTKGGWTLVK
jgi:hypothetical protein